MKFIYRVGYYSGGFVIGLILLFFFLSGKRASCDYSPNARTLKNIRIKERVFSEHTLKELKLNEMDTSAISELLKDGNVRFSESITNLDSCKIYLIEGKVSEKNLKIRVENCDSTATILETIIIK
jgi:hypothetical protein